MNHHPHNLPGPWRARPLRTSRALVLVFAVLLHAAVLLIPLRQTEPPFSRAPVEVELWTQQPAEPVAPEPDPLPEPAPEEPAQAARPDVVERPPEPAVVAVRPADAEQQSDFVITAAFLYDAAARIEWAEPDPPSLVLGIAPAYELPDNLAKRVLPLTPNWFDGMSAPQEVEVLDRWTEADGSMMVVMRTPTGHTLCGRGDAYDPLNPLVENVMMFRTCGGGGSRIKPAP